MTKALLTTIFNAGTFYINMANPSKEDHFLHHYLEHGKLDAEKLNYRLYRLEREGLIEREDKDGRIALILKEKGKKKALRFKIDDMKIKKPELWDGKWRVVMFDVPNEKKTARDYFQNKLKELGFIQIQKSVYAHPFECEEELNMIRDLFEIKHNVKLMLVDHFEGENKYLGKFGLSKKTE
jgi:DNA-binding transcriptional regulator PaaX